MAVLDPDDIPADVARAAFRMFTRTPDTVPAVEVFRRILAACAPLVPGFGGTPQPSTDAPAPGGSSR